MLRVRGHKSKRPLSYHWQIRDFVHWDCNIKVRLNHKVPIPFHNLNNYDLHLIMQELNKFAEIYDHEIYILNNAYDGLDLGC